MTIGLYNLEPKYTNLALEKIRAYHTQRGDIAYDYNHIEHERYDKIYCSSLFTWSDKSYVTDDMICGGTGFDLTTTLPPEIDEITPRINIGFTTRGCIRHCPFCVVPEKEGRLRQDNAIDEFWDGIATAITVMDNNWLADKDWFMENARLVIDMGLAVREHGLDIRLIDPDTAQILSLMKHDKQYHFAWDLMKDEPLIMNGLNTLLEYIRPYKIMFYVLVGFNTSEEEDLYRVEKLREKGIDPFVMPFNKNPKCKDFARWVNHKAIFKSVPWKEYHR